MAGLIFLSPLPLEKYFGRLPFLLWLALQSFFVAGTKHEILAKNVSLFEPQFLHGPERFVNVINPTNSGCAILINFILFLFQHSKAVHNVDSVNEIDFIN